ncbi:MAG: hypothetical protein ACKVVP_00875 [Chloroflexota bacterium]
MQASYVTQSPGSRRRAKSPVIGVIVMVVGLALLLGFHQTTGIRRAEAQGADSCPEPNDEFQTACLLSPDVPARGFIWSPGDVDAYRLENPDFDTRMKLELKSPGLRFRVILANWNGEVLQVAGANNGLAAIEATLPLPGTYYAFVQSETGASSADQPYELGVRWDLTTSHTPKIIWSFDYRPLTTDGVTGASDAYQNLRADGKQTTTVRQSGTTQAPKMSWNALSGSHDLRDFTFTFDSRQRSNVTGGYMAYFRYRDSNNFHQLFVNLEKRQAMVIRWVDNQRTVSLEWTNIAALQDPQAVNRTTISARRGTLSININGQNVLSLPDDPTGGGDFGYGTITWGDPASVSFDNVLVAVPSTPAGAMILRDDFSDPRNPVLTTYSSPTGVGSIVEGEYVLTTTDPAGDQSAGRYLPLHHRDAELTIDTRLVGDPKGKYVALECRVQDSTSVADGYRLSIYPENGTFAMRRYIDGNEEMRVAHRASSAIRRNGESNTIGLRCAASTITALVNGVEVASFEDSAYRTGRFRISAGSFRGAGPVDARFDNLRVVQP